MIDSTGSSSARYSTGLTVGVLRYLACLVALVVLSALVLAQAGVAQLACRPPASASDDEHLNGLLIAIQSSDVPAVRRLLARRPADACAVDRLGLTPIYHAPCARGASGNEMVELLIEAGADVNGPRGVVPPLMHMAVLRRPDLVERLLRAGADPRARLANGWTALHHAAQCGDTATVAILLAGGADPTAVDDEGKSPSTVAMESGFADVAAHLEQPHQRVAGSMRARNRLIVPNISSPPTSNRSL